MTNSKPNTSDIFSYIDEKKELHLERLRRFIRQRSVSPTSDGIFQFAELLEKEFHKIGIDETKIVQTQGNPIVWGKIDRGCERTLALYMMYDTQPAFEKEEGWSVPSFDGVVKHLPNLGQCMVARGAANSKGPSVAFLNALESIISQRGKLPVNLIIFAEGEEEIGSKSLPGFLKEYKGEISRAKGVICPSCSQDARGIVQIFLGNKGILQLELRSGGGRWDRGPQEYDIHSSGKAIIDSPVWRLVDALSTVAKKNGNEIMIKDLLKDVVGPDTEDLKMIKKLAHTADLKSLSKYISSVEHFIDEEKGLEDLLTRYLFSTTFNIAGFKSGYTGEGFKTVLPHEAIAKIDIRLVPNQTPERALSAVREHFRTNGYSDIEVHEYSNVPWAKTSGNSLVNRAFIEAADDLNIQTEIWPIAPGTGPWYLFNGKIVDVPHLVNGLVTGGRPHSPDEYFVIEGEGKTLGLYDCEKGYVNFIYRFAST